MTEDPFAAIRAAVEELERTQAADRAQSDRRTAELAEAARRGDLGRDWQKLQSRVDHGESTWAEVFSGRDGSSEASAVLAHSRTRLADLADDVLADDDLCAQIEELTTLRERITRWDR